MLDFTVDASGVPDHLESTRLNIMRGIRGGLEEATKVLADAVAAKLDGSPIVTRTGKLLARVLKSPAVIETDHYFKGTVDGNVDGKLRGLWLEEGTQVPAVQGVLYMIGPPDGPGRFAWGHRAFKVAPHPFLNPALQETSATLVDIITARIAEECE